jgi:hypothetical protein
VFVTGTFDDWGKTERLEPTDHGFEKEVSLPFSKEKIYYKVRKKKRMEKKEQRRQKV